LSFSILASLNPSKSTFFHALTLFLLPKNHMLFIVSKQCACSRRVHIEGDPLQYMKVECQEYSYVQLKGILSTKIVIFSFPKLLSVSLLTFIKWRLRPLFLLPKNHMLFIVSKQCACSRRVHIEGHMNRFEFLLSWTIIPITIALVLFLCKKNRIFCSITRS
jgi:hypothetical protein